ncbi:MAG TPA: FAD-dependent oxidoreductase, partial [Desulfarculaceae bacterium]|nr:FAD-dependent oxidoreductase [Desulfarculaceae bacterium]
LDEIKEIIDAFAQAALRVKTAGFDAVEVLSGTGYLISEFLSPLTNQRTDAYGGSLENRMRFGLEVMTAIRNAVDSDYPLIVRMNGNDFMPGGNSRQELTEYAQNLAQGPADALCINVGWHEARVPQIVTCVPHGAFSYLSRSIKEKVDIPVIACHRINDPETARELLADSMCDMVAMGRSLITDPQLPEKARQGREEQILHCIGCAQGCFDNLFKVKHVECLCNPEAGHEGQKNLEKTTNPKKVMVVGGGPGGMSAALAAALKGHAVTLYEQSERLGGQLYLAAAPPGREDFSRLAKDLEEQLAVNRIPVVFNQSVDGSLIASEKPDVVIVATGAKSVIPPIPGTDLPHVVQAWDVLEDKVATGLKVAIIGGGAVGVETALFLAEKGTLSAEAVKFLLVNKAETPEVLYEMATRGSKQVVLVEMLDKVGKDIGKSTRWGMMQELSRAGIKSVTKHTVTEITATGLTMEKDGEIVKVEADTIVIAAGSTSINSLESVLKEMQLPYQVVGDAKQAALAFDAIHQGYAAGLSL